MFTYRDLEAWQLGMQLVEVTYELTKRFPREEQYGLTSQTRRAAVSIPSNLAEGHCRRTTGAFANHVSIGLGSYGELDTCIEVAQRLGYLGDDGMKRFLAKAPSVGRCLNGLYNALELKIAARRKE